MSRLIYCILWSFVLSMSPCFVSSVWADEGRVIVRRSPAEIDERAPSGSGRRLYVSGHSLTSPRVVGFLGQLAAAAGIDLTWNLQYLEGSSIRQRRGAAPDAPYRNGVDRWGRPADVLGEFSASSGDGRPIDTLIVTEQHAVLVSLAWEDTIATLRDIHDRFIQTNPAGRTIFFEPWLSIDDKSAPQGWIAYERAAGPVWGCIVAKVNQSLALDGKSGRLASIPLGLSLAHLVERAIRSPSSTEFLGKATADKVSYFFKDDVHLTDAGDFYVASVMFRYLFGGDAKSGWRPADLDGKVAGFIERTAVEFVASGGNRPSEDLSKCQEYIERTFLDLFIDYYSKAELRKRSNYIEFIYSRWRLDRGLSSIFRKGGASGFFSGSKD